MSKTITDLQKEAREIKPEYSLNETLELCIEWLRNDDRSLPIEEMVSAIHWLGELSFQVTSQAPITLEGNPTCLTCGEVYRGPHACPGFKEQQEFTIMLISAVNKMPVIRVIREITSLNLKESRDLVICAPKVVKKNVYRDEAFEIKAKLEAAGAVVELK